MSMDNRRGPSSPNNTKQQNRSPGNIRFSMLWVILLVALVVADIIVVPLIQGGNQNHTSIPYSEFKTLVGRNVVTQITTQGNSITGTFKAPQNVTTDDGKAAPAVKDFATQLPPYTDNGLAALLQSHGVTQVNKAPDNGNALLGLL